MLLFSNKLQQLISFCRPNYQAFILLGLFILGMNLSYGQIVSQPLNKSLPPVSSIEKVQACVLVSKSNQELLRQLKWLSAPNKMCGGYYSKYKAKPTKGFELTADEVNLALSGKSTVRGNVVVHHDGKQISAALAHIYRANGKVTDIELIGNMEFIEEDHLLIASNGKFKVKDYSGYVSNALYRLFLISDNVELESRQGQLTAWGRACLIKRDKKGNLSLYKASYSTCPPGAKIWSLKTNKLQLLKQESKGIAHNATLYIKNIPVLYLPYISFPLDLKRESGFLLTDIEFSSKQGTDLQVPYYFNLAPNYDATIYPRYMSKRGLMVGGELRYLFDSSNGIAYASFIDKDKSFERFKKDNLWLAPQLANIGTERYHLRWTNNSKLSDNLNLNINFEQVSDDYYFQDYSNNLSQSLVNQLSQQLQLTYNTEHWQYSALLQRYQTLHAFNQAVVSGIYERLPSLRAIGNYADLPYDFVLNVLAQLDKFSWHGLNSNNIVQGERYHVAPTLSLPIDESAYFIKPEFTLHSSYYNLAHYNGQNKSISRVIPISSLDLGLFFEKDLNHNWRQTLEPRLYYLYVPYMKQFNIPIFDSGLFFPSFSQLFRNNRFVGVDRVGDANQLSGSLTTRFIDDSNGAERLRLSIGSYYKFQKQRVFGCQNFNGMPCTDDLNRVGYISSEAGLAPLQFLGELKLSNSLSVFSNLDYVLSNRKITSAIVNFHYEPQLNHIVDASYRFLLNGDQAQLVNSFRTNTNWHQFRLSYAWPLNDHWRTLASWSYNIGYKFTPSYLFGLQYDDCCVAVRLLGGKVFRYFTPGAVPFYDEKVYIQLLLKGLGTVAKNNPTTAIVDALPTFKDEFK